jgi:putative membrane protein
LIGGILGIIIVFSVYMTLGALESFTNAFGGDSTWTQDLGAQIGVGIILYMIAIILPFVIKDTKPVGIILVVLAFSTFIAAGYFGILGFVLLLTAGILAIKFKPKNISSSSLEILKQRYAQGEITKEEFDEMKKDLN